MPESEEVVFEEAFGGKHNSTKCAYSLIYISQEVASQLDQASFVSYANSEFLAKGLSPQLIKQVQESNLKFDKELIDYKVEKISKVIAEKLK